MDGIACNEQPCARADRSIGQSTQLYSATAETAAIIVCAVDQVAHVELGKSVAALELHAPLRIGVIE